MTESITLRYVRGKASAADYWQDQVSPEIFDEPCRYIPALRPTLYAALERQFWRLHALDRADPFWNHSNRLATLFKLAEFNHREMASGEHGVDAAWAHIAMATVFGGSLPLERRPWEILRDAGVLDASAMVGLIAAVIPYNDSSFPPEWVRLVRQLGLEPTVSAALQRFAANNPDERSWAEDALTNFRHGE